MPIFFIIESVFESIRYKDINKLNKYYIAQLLIHKDARYRNNKQYTIIINASSVYILLVSTAWGGVQTRPCPRGIGPSLTVLHDLMIGECLAKVI